MQTTQTKQEILTHPCSISDPFCAQLSIFQTSQWQISFTKKTLRYYLHAVTQRAALLGFEIWLMCYTWCHPQHLGSSFLHSWFNVLGRWESWYYTVIPICWSQCFVPTGILINKHSLQAHTVPSQQKESSVFNVSTAGMKAHGGIAQSEARRQLIFSLWLAKLCCSYTNGNGMCMSVLLFLPSLSHLSRQ